MREINLLREEISALDQDLKALLLKRMALSLEVADYKEQHHQAILVPSREAEILQEAARGVPPPMDGCMRRIFGEIMANSRGLQEDFLKERAMGLSRKKERVFFQKILIVGLGLIGGSLAKSIRRRLPFCSIYAAEPDGEAVRRASKEGVINGSFDEVDKVFGSFDLALICTPPQTVAGVLDRLLPVVGHRCLICDTAGVKGSILCHAEAMERPISFVGGHPMAGSDRGGYAAAREDLTLGTVFVLTPCSKTPPGLLKRFCDFLEALGAVPILMDAQAHDRAVGVVSHLPHLAAAALCHMLEFGREEVNHGLVAGGFLDTTRIAAADPALWAQLSAENREALGAALRQYISILQHTQEELGDVSAMTAYFEKGKDKRSALKEQSEKS